jgi:hypothetical protein
MAVRDRIIHFYDADRRAILCGVVDREAHWTSRNRVTCADCAARLRERTTARASATPAHAPDAAAHA